ncbi:hypothetical protein DE146DRAFT_606338 [Phaeosphaeria sp. MPI-PUGE-AT-0046c]|nr:hypothetical protein DE146DRAFT_606338 [Phaeosphaeria sp. MPI-PUGE-AT-0046c]
MERHRNHPESSSPELETKRRKLRKGTTSCWDCKKRKVKCTFDSTSETVCIACRRRGAPCIGQDQPEEELQSLAESNRDPLAERLERVESLLEDLIKIGHRVENDVGSHSRRTRPESTPHLFTPTGDYQSQTRRALKLPSNSDVPTSSNNVTNTDPEDENCKLSEELLKAFPSQDDVNKFCKSNYIATFYCHKMFLNSDEHDEHEAFEFVDDLARIPQPSTHPVLIAKRMLVLALFLQYFQSQGWHDLPDRPHLVMDRLVDTAVRLVTSNEKVICCMEGLECVILEGLFHTKGGNLRRAWLAYKKGSILAQLLKIDLPNPAPVKILSKSFNVNPRFTWFRLVYMDAMISLMLDLPHAGQELNIEHDCPGATPSCKLERVHTLVSRRIIDRNRRNTFHKDLDTTRELDQELLNAAKALPDKFWAPPNFTALTPNTREAFWEIMRMCDQVHHLNLVHLLHLPYLLRSDKENSYNAYSKITCVNASRELLRRFIAFRQFNYNATSIYCRTADFLALMASMTLLLAHIDSHKVEGPEWQAHQRLGDRAMVLQLVELLEETGTQTADNLTRKSAEQLSRLLGIESDVAQGLNLSAECTVSCLEENCGELQLHIPYFGIINIGREGISRSIQPNVVTSQPTANDITGSVHVANHLFSTVGFGEVLHEPQPSYFQPIPETQPVQTAHLPLVDANTDTGHRQLDNQAPALMASVEDWAFQGVDTAFFNSLIRGAEEWDPALHNNVG